MAHAAEVDDRLSTSAAARELGVSSCRVRQLLAAGALPGVERTALGRLIPRAAVVALAEERRRRAAGGDAGGGVRDRLTAGERVAIDAAERRLTAGRERG